MATAKGLTADLLAARRKGLSYAAIAARFDITKQAAWERITRAEKAAASPFERVVELRSAGKTATEIEKKTGFSHAVVLKHISSGIAAGRIARRNVSRREREPEILALREAGKTRPEIAAALGVSLNTVREVIGLAIEQGRARKMSREEVDRRRDAGYQAYRAGKAKPVASPAEAEVIDIPAFLPPRVAPAHPAAVTYTLPPDFVPAAVDTATAGDVITIVERPITEADDDYLPPPLPEDQPPKGWSTRIAASIARLFGGRS